jgi:hypothetical protein
MIKISHTLAAHDMIRFRLSHHVNRRFGQCCPLHFPELPLASFSPPVAGRIRLRRSLRIQHRFSIPSLSLVCVSAPIGTAEFCTKCRLNVGEAIEQGGSDSYVVIPRSALARLSHSVRTPFGMSESKTSNRKSLEFCENDFSACQRFIQFLICD